MSMELALLGELLQLARDPEVSLEEFGHKAATSPQLAAEIVRVSNSALYGMEGRVNRLERAVLILGIRTVADIASSVLVARRMKSMDIEGLPSDALWMHSLRVGVCAQLVARCVGLPMESEGYLSGLLHDIGILELHDEHGTRYAELIRRAARERTPLDELEQQTLGETHATRLHDLAGDWHFPEILRAALLHHHHPAEADEEARPLVSLVYAAHILTLDLDEGWSETFTSDDDQAFMVDLGISDEDCEDIRSLLDERIVEIASVIG